MKTFWMILSVVAFLIVVKDLVGIFFMNKKLDKINSVITILLVMCWFVGDFVADYGLLK